MRAHRDGARVLAAADISRSPMAALQVSALEALFARAADTSVPSAGDVRPATAVAGLAASCICYSPTFFNEVFVPVSTR
jgi:hypothetical protein